MKRVKVRPGATVPVNDQMLARARDALAAFGVQEHQLLELARFRGDITIGPRPGKKKPAKRP